MADSTGQADIRGLNVTKTVTGFALQEYVFKQLCIVQKTSAWQDRYFQETAADLTGGLGEAVEGVPRLAAFPYGEVSFTQQNSYMKKHAMETRISWEDAKTNDVDVIARSLLRIARAIAKSVDAEIWDVITEGRAVVNINLCPAKGIWATSTNSPVQDILSGCTLIANQNYNPQKGGYLCVNPNNYKDLVQWLVETKGASIPQYASDKIVNGKVAELLGLTVLVSPSVTAGFAAIVISKEAATWKSVQDLTVRTLEDAGIGYTVRAWEIGACQLKNPKAVCLLSGT